MTESAVAVEAFWNEVIDVDAWLDEGVAPIYGNQYLAQDWARVAKIAEETGEAIAELILATGQNPRKGTDPDARRRMLDEMADVALTAILGMHDTSRKTAQPRARSWSSAWPASGTGRRILRVWRSLLLRVSRRRPRHEP